MLGSSSNFFPDFRWSLQDVASSDNEEQFFATRYMLKIRNALRLKKRLPAKHLHKLTAEGSAATKEQEQMFDAGGEASSSLEAIKKTTSLTSSTEETLNSMASVQEDAQQPQGTEMRPSAETDEADQSGPKRSQARETTTEQEQDILLAQSEVKERTLDDCCCTGEDQLWIQERKRKREEGEGEVADAVDNGNSCTVDLVLTLNEKDGLSETQQQKQDDDDEEEKEEEEDPKEVLQQGDSESSPSQPVALPEPSRLDVFGIVGVSSWEEEQVEVKKEEEELLRVERLLQTEHEEEEEENDDDEMEDYTQDMTVFI